MGLRQESDMSETRLESGLRYLIFYGICSQGIGGVYGGSVSGGFRTAVGCLQFFRRNVRCNHALVPKCFSLVCYCGQFRPCPRNVATTLGPLVGGLLDDRFEASELKFM